MMRFYIVKRDERDGDGLNGVVEFDTVESLERFLSYNRGYIESMKTLDSKENK